VALLVTQMPAHNHMIGCVDGDPNDASPANKVAAHIAAGGYQTSAPNATMAPNAISPTGGSQPHENRQPYTVLNWIIALEGIFPSRQ